LMVFLFLIPAHTIFLAIMRKKVSDRVYAPITLCISISLILLFGLRSNHVLGADVHTEYYIFQQTLANGQWQILMHNPLDNCLSISILPAVYQSFINMNSEYLFKILYPILFSISPLVVYIISRKYLNSLYSFLAAMFFMSQVYFLEAAYSPRTVVAILFFALAFMALIQNGLTSFQKYILFIIFAASCIISHYSTTYIFFIVLILTWIIMQIVLRIYKKRGATMQNSMDMTNKIKTGLAFTRLQPKHYITFGATALVFVMIFLWYSLATGPAFSAGVRFVDASLSSIQSFFDMGSRGASAVAFGSGIGSKTIPQQLTFIFSWITIVFIAIGVLVTLIRYRHTVAMYSDSEAKVPYSLVQKLDIEYFIISLVCSIILALAVAVPFVFVGYDMNRTFCQMLTVLSPFFIIGGILIARLFRTKLAYAIVLLALIPYLMCTTGTMYQIFGSPQSITLNSKGQAYDIMYVHEQETCAARWLSNYSSEDTPIYADNYGERRLISQGEIRSAVYAKAFIEKGTPLGEGYIYLRYCGVVDGKLLDNSYNWHDITDYQEEFAKRNLLYSNGGSEVYK